MNKKHYLAHKKHSRNTRYCYYYCIKYHESLQESCKNIGWQYNDYIRQCGRYLWWVTNDKTWSLKPYALMENLQGRWVVALVPLLVLVAWGFVDLGWGSLTFRESAMRGGTGLDDWSNSPLLHMFLLQLAGLGMFSQETRLSLLQLWNAFCWL